MVEQKLKEVSSSPNTKKKDEGKKESSSFFAAMKLKEGDTLPNWKQRVRTILALGGAYYFVSMRVLKPMMKRYLRNHPQFENLMSRKGMFNPSAHDEVIYVALAGIHHTLGGLLGRFTLEMLKQGKGDMEVGPFNVRALHLYSGLWEYGYEITDWVLMILRQWPYQVFNPLFSLLITAHHSFGLLSFWMFDHPAIFNLNLASTMNPVLLVAGMSFLFYPYQQLQDLATQKGVRTALYLNVVNTILFTYVRFYILPVKGLQFVKDIFLDKESETRDTTKAKRIFAAFGMLSIFNVLVLKGSVDKCFKYYKMLSDLKRTAAA